MKEKIVRGRNQRRAATREGVKLLNQVGLVVIAALMSDDCPAKRGLIKESGQSVMKAFDAGKCFGWQPYLLGEMALQAA